MKAKRCYPAMLCNATELLSSNPREGPGTVPTGNRPAALATVRRLPEQIGKGRNLG